MNLLGLKEMFQLVDCFRQLLPVNGMKSKPQVKAQGTLAKGDHTQKRSD